MSAPPPHGGPPTGYPPAGYPPAGGRGYPPAGGMPGYPPAGGRGYPPAGGRGYPPAGGMPGGYPPAGGMPGAYPPAGGMPGAYPQSGYPPAYGAAGGKMTKDQKKKKKEQEKLQKKQKKGKPGAAGGAAAAQNKWYAQYYNQIQPHELQPLQQWFAAVDTDRSGEISAAELATAKWPGDAKLDVETVRKLIRVFDNDHSGTISFYEYASMHKFIVRMQQAFAMYDRDRSQSLEPHELQPALHAAGFAYVTEMSVRPFIKKIQKTNVASVTFASFVALCTQLSHVGAVFDKMDNTRTGRVTLDKAQFSKVMLSVLV